MNTTLTASLQTYFTTYLTGQKAASAHTISAYRDTWRMLLTHIHETTGVRPADMAFTDLGADAVTRFLQYLETERLNSVRTGTLNHPGFAGDSVSWEGWGHVEKIWELPEGSCDVVVGG